MVCKAGKITLGVMVLGLCGSHSFAQHEGHAQQQSAQAKMTALTKAVAILHPTAGNKAQGTVTFAQEAGGVRVTANISGVPAGEHGFHIHEFGDCSAADGVSAGGHFNPSNMAHGAQNAPTRHVGDLGNVTADADGNITLDLLDARMSLNGPHSIVGRGLILHANPDDFKTQPTGNAGGRIACGVIGVAKP
jgi:Cu-Zn family superoxide dismutase